MTEKMEEQVHLLHLNDPQFILEESLNKQDMKMFKYAMEIGGNLEVEDSMTNITIFEKCCQTPKCNQFIKECMRSDCDTNRLNQHFNKHPINYVAESQDIDNFKVLLEDTSINLDYKYQDQTATDFLISIINDTNFDKILECLKFLIKRQANLNVPNKKGMTACFQLIKQQYLSNEHKEFLLKYFLKNSTIDLDTYREGELRIYLTKNFRLLELPKFVNNNFNKSNFWDFKKLIRILRTRDENHFIWGFEIFIHQNEVDDRRRNLFCEFDDNETLLMVTAKLGLYKACEKLLRNGAPVNFSPIKSASPVKLACIYGNWKILQLLLNYRGFLINENESLLSILIKNIGERHQVRGDDFNKCFEMLINFKDIDINQKDIDNNSPLHYAVNHRNKFATSLLLEKGAYIGGKNKLSNLPITDIDPKLLENHLNKCILTNDLSPGDYNYEVHFNYKNLVPIYDAPITDANKSLSNSKIDNLLSVNYAGEIGPIEYMSRSNELKHLLNHPLISSFLFLKWHRLALIFYLNFILYSIYSLSMLLYIIFCYSKDASKGLTLILVSLTVFGAVYVFLREFIQLLFSPKSYLKLKENYIEIALFVMTILVLYNREYDMNTRKTIAAFAILLAIVEFFLLTGSLPIMSFSIHLVMLQTVAKSFLRSLTFYSSILIGFAMSFYVLLGDDGYSNAIKIDLINGTTDNNPIVMEEEQSEVFATFKYPFVAIVKTIVMLTGEFEGAGINFNKNESSYIVFLIFIFLISNVMVNLLNGLAVSDIQVVKAHAELITNIQTASILLGYERIISGNETTTGCCKMLLRKWASSIMSLFPYFLPCGKIIVLPNSKNRVLIPTIKAYKHKKLKTSIKFKKLKCIAFPFGYAIGHNCSRMEPEVVKLAKQVLEQKEREQADSMEKEAFNKRIDRINDRLDEIVEKINRLFGNKMFESLHDDT